MAFVLPRLYAHSNKITQIQTKLHLEEFKYLIKWRENPSIMEFGHGDGAVTKNILFPVIPSDVKEFIATDLSERMVDYARKHSIGSSIKYMQLDIGGREVPNEFLNRFDHIFGFFVMHWVKDPRQGFTNMFRMLKKGGSAFLSIFERSPIDDVFEHLSKHPEWGKYGHDKVISPYYFSPNPRREYERNLKEGGFTTYEMIKKDYLYDFDDEEEFENMNLAVNPVIAEIPEHSLEEYKKIYLENSKKSKATRVDIRNGRKIYTRVLSMLMTSATKS